MNKYVGKESYTLKQNHKFEGVRLYAGDSIMAYPHQIERIKRIENSNIGEQQCPEDDAVARPKDEIDFLSQDSFYEKKGDK